MVWSELTDSHHEIITEHQLRETDARGAINCVPIEIYPESGNLKEPISKWVFKVDYQGITRDLPEWFDGEKAEAAARSAAKAWKKQKVITRKTKELTEGHYYIYADVDTVRGSAVIGYVSGSAVIKDVRGYAVIEDVRGSAVIECVSNSAVIEYVRDSAVIEYVCGSAVIKDVSGSAVIECVSGSAVIEYVRGSAVIKDVRGSAVIGYVSGSAVIIVYTVIDPTCLKTQTAVMIDRSVYGKVTVHVGK